MSEKLLLYEESPTDLIIITITVQSHCNLATNLSFISFGWSYSFIVSFCNVDCMVGFSEI